jgi:hypothetical protein
MNTGCPSPMQQPALLRLAEMLFCADAILRHPQTTVSPAFIFHKIKAKREK